MYHAHVLRQDGKVETRIWTEDPKQYQVVEVVSREEHEREFYGLETRVFRNQEVLPVEYSDVMLHAEKKDEDIVRSMWLMFLSERAAIARKHGRTYAQTLWDTQARDRGEWPDDWLGDGAIPELAECAVGQFWRAANKKEERLMEFEVANGASNHWRFLKAKEKMQ